MQKIRVKDLLNKLMGTIPLTAQTDVLLSAIDEEYSFFREKPWTWNYRWTKTLTKAAVSEVPTFDWVEGNDYVVASAALTYDYFLTGRIVKLGLEWYRVIDYGVANAARIYVDRPILGSAEDQTLTFCRDDIFLHTSSIRGLKQDERVLIHKNEEDLLSRLPYYVYSDTTAEAGTPVLWMDEIKSRDIPTPGFSPTVTSAGAGVLPQGEYEYFFTRYDWESGAESAPGPSTIYNNTSGFAANVIYGNAGDVSEYTSYSFRLYRSRINSKDTRPRRPLWLVNTRPPTASAYVDSTSDVVLVTNPRYYNGSSTLIRLYPPPDSTRHSIQIDHVDCWEGRPHDDEYLIEGRNQEFSSAMLLYLRSIADFGSNTELYMVSQQAHRRHMEYLLTKSKKPGNDSVTVGTYVEAVPGDDRSGDWLDRAPWKGDW